MSPLTILLVVLAGLGLVGLAVTLCLIYNRRHLQPIRSRQTSGGYFLLPIGIAYGILVTFDIIFVVVTPKALPNLAKSIMMHSMGPMLGCLYLARAMVLLIQHRRSLYLQAKLQVKNRSPSGHHDALLDKTADTQRPHFLTIPNTFRLHCAVFFTIALLWITSVVYDMNVDGMNWLYLFYLIIIAVTAIVLAWNLRFCHDSYGISKELLLVAISITLFTILNNIAKANIAASSTKPLKMHSIMVAECFILSMITLVHPLALSFMQQQPSSSSNPRKNVVVHPLALSFMQQQPSSSSNPRKNVETTQRLSLCDVLRSPAHAAAFALHLQKEFALENLMFYRDTKHIIDMIDSSKYDYDQQIISVLDRLCGAFLNSNAPFEVNLSSASKTHLASAIGNVKAVWMLDKTKLSDADVEPKLLELHRMLGVCQSEIFGLMKT